MVAYSSLGHGMQIIESEIQTLNISASLLHTKSLNRTKTGLSLKPVAAEDPEFENDFRQILGF